MERTPTVGIVVLKEDDVLLVRHGEAAGHITGSYGTPGGRLDYPDENLKSAVLRELNEESGLIAAESDLVELPTKYDADLPRKDGSILHTHHTVFATRKFTGELVATDEAEPVWTPIKNLPEMELLPNTENMVKEAIENV